MLAGYFSLCKPLIANDVEECYPFALTNNLGNLVMMIGAALLLGSIAGGAPMPTCRGADDCAVKWGRAIRWVMDHNPTIVRQNDVTIATDEPLGKRHKYVVTLIPDGGGQYTIDMRMGCTMLRKCPRDELKADFLAQVGRD